MQKVLEEKIGVIMNKEETDSPVFLFLPQLLNSDAAPPAAPTAAPADSKSFADLMETFKQAKNGVKRADDWRGVLEVLDRIQNLQPNDPYVIQQRSLATYKSEYPGKLSSLQAARTVLEALKPDTSSDAETVGIWGAIHKRLWTATGNRDDLDVAVRSYGRGYFIKDDYYNGINYAFLLNVRAAASEGDDAIADRVMARRIRKEVLTLCDTMLRSETLSIDDKFWIDVTKVEALLGLGQTAESDALRQTVVAAFDKEDWRVKSLSDQLEALAALQP
jgi:hypothetical protein